MSKRKMRPGNMVYPVPAALVSCADRKGNTNLITVAWTGTVCSDPAMLYISVRKERFSHHMLEETGEFVLNLTSADIIEATDTCGVKSGRDVNKWELTGLTPGKAFCVSAPLVKESPVNIECRVTEKLELGSHDMFLAEVLSVDADEGLFDKNDRLDLSRAGLAAYSHGTYYELGKALGTFGYSVNKKKNVPGKKDEAPEKKCCDPKVAKACGGCQYANTAYGKQLEIKQKYIDGLLGKFCEKGVCIEPIVGMDAPWHYRNKVHHAFGYDRKAGIISGSYRSGTHDIVNVDSCLVEDEKALAIIKTVRGLCPSFKIKAYDEDTGMGLLRHVLIRKGHATGEIMVVLVCSSQILPGKNNFVKALLKEHPEITTIVLNVNNKKTSMILGDFEKPIYGPGFIKDKICGCTFCISPKSFFQVNPVQTEKLYAAAMEFAGPGKNMTIIDAYCGTGTIGITAAKKMAGSGQVYGIELNEDAVRDAKKNAAANDIKNIRFYNSDAAKWINGYNGPADVIFMDPPRSGSTEAFMKACVRLSPGKIVYISCGPDTLARDLEYFTSHGYKVKKIRPVDMFPHTEHCECVVLLSKHS